MFYAKQINKESTFQVLSALPNDEWVVLIGYNVIRTQIDGATHKNLASLEYDRDLSYLKMIYFKYFLWIFIHEAIVLTDLCHMSIFLRSKRSFFQITK